MTTREHAILDYNTAYNLLVDTSKLLYPMCNVTLPLIGDYRTELQEPPELLDIIYQTVINIDNVCKLLTSAIKHCYISELLSAVKIHKDVLNTIISEYINNRIMEFDFTDEIDYVQFPLYKVYIRHNRYMVSSMIQSGICYSGSIHHTGSEHTTIATRMIVITRGNVQRLLTPKIYYNMQPVIQYFSPVKLLSIVNEYVPQGEEEDTCPICFNEIAKGKMLRTNCEHGFCLQCMINYAESIKRNTTHPTCPCCRRVIVGVKSGDKDICRQFSNHITSM